MSDPSDQGQRATRHGHDGKDWVLSALVEAFTGAHDESRNSVSVTVQSNGATITGMLISGDEYFENLAAQFREAAGPVFADAMQEIWSGRREEGLQQQDQRDERGLPPATRRYIHMRDVSILAGPAIVRAPHWRGTLDDITGWCLGSYSFEG